jgi:hypothetical protein
MSLALGFTIYALNKLEIDVESAFVGGNSYSNNCWCNGSRIATNCYGR